MPQVSTARANFLRPWERGPPRRLATESVGETPRPNVDLRISSNLALSLSILIALRSRPLLPLHWARLQMQKVFQRPMSHESRLLADEGARVP